MYPYFILIGLPAFFGLFTNRQTQGGIGLLFVLVIFTGLIGLRYDIGPDWFAYTMQAERLPVMPFGELVAQGEFGWSLVAIICDQLGLGVQGLAFISALVFVAGVVAVARSVEEPMLAVIAAVPYLSIAVAMSGMRQATAMGIIFIAVGFWYRLPLWGRIALILFASTFHFTALALLFVVALEADLKPIAKGAAAAAVFVIVLYFVTVTDFRIDRYAENYFGEGGAANAEGAFLHVALTGVPCIVYFMFRGRWIEKFGRIPLLDIFAAIGALAMVVVLIAPTATDRMTLYFAAIALIISGNLPRLWDRRPEQYAVRTALILANFAAMVVFLTLGNKAGSFVPYQSIFSENAELGITRRGF